MSTSTPLDASVRPTISTGSTSSWRDIVRHGLIAGALGYVVVASSFALANVIGGRSPFYTAALLGAALFDGARDPAGVTVTAAPVAKYNLVHLLVFLGFGLLTAWLASMAERATQLWYVALFAFIFVGFHTIGAAQLFASPMEEAVSAPVVWVTGIVASIIMAGYVISKHPKLRRAERWDDASTQASGS